MTDRQSTHAADCWSWGLEHYECAVREIWRLREELSKMRGALHAAAEYIGDRSAGSSTFWDLYDAVLAKGDER